MRRTNGITSAVSTRSVRGSGHLSGSTDEFFSGELPFKKLTLVRAWIVLHREELEADWALLGEGREAFRIEPLR